tara:strand:+ start:636 stop:1298 length:663 start_codon:yes stop_codon:yes gene_type:complete
VALTKFNFNSFDLTTAAGKGLAFNSSANGLETATADSMTLIKTLTASSSSNLAFVDGSSSVVLDNTYPVYLFKLINLHVASSGTLMRIFGSTDSGSNYNVAMTTSYHYAGHLEDDSATFLAIENRGGENATNGIYFTDTIGADNDQSISGTVILFNPSSTTFVKHYMTEINNAGDPQTQSNHVFTGGYMNTTSAVDAIKFQADTGNIDSGTIKLYGIGDS